MAWFVCDGNGCLLACLCPTTPREFPCPFKTRNMPILHLKTPLNWNVQFWSHAILQIPNYRCASIPGTLNILRGTWQVSDSRFGIGRWNRLNSWPKFCGRCGNSISGIGIQYEMRALVNNEWWHDQPIDQEVIVAAANAKFRLRMSDCCADFNLIHHFLQERCCINSSLNEQTNIETSTKVNGRVFVAVKGQWFSICLLESNLWIQ